METKQPEGHNKPDFAVLLAQLANELPPERVMALAVLGIVYTDDLARMFEKEHQTLKNAISKREIPTSRFGSTSVHLVDSIRTWLKEIETRPHGSR